VRIGIDARFAVRNRRGIGNYTLKLIQNLAVMDSENKYILYVDREDSENILPQNNNFKVSRLVPSNYFLWEQIALPIQAKKDAIDILHCTGNTAPIFLNKRIKLVVTIHDVMYLKDYYELPKSQSIYQRIGRVYRRAIVPRTIRRLSKVLTVSEFSRRDIMKHLPHLKCEQIRVTYEAANESFKCIDKSVAFQKTKDMLGIEEGFVIALGAMDPRKNTASIIKTFIELKKERCIKEKLVVVGIPNWKNTVFYDIVLNSDLKEHIIFTDFISESDLVFLYNSSIVFLYPSMYEGFGIPILEAMSCGVPVITSNRTSIPEITGDCALLINPDDRDDIKKTLIRLLSDTNMRDELIKRGVKRAKEFSWKKMAKETIEIYKGINNMTDIDTLCPSRQCVD